MGVVASKITRVIGVGDMKRATEFYVSALGLTVERENEYWTDLTCGNGNLALQRSPGTGDTDTRVMVIFTVESRDQAVKAVEEGGGSLVRLVDNEHAPVILAHVRDTENNIIQLAQLR